LRSPDFYHCIHTTKNISDLSWRGKIHKKVAQDLEDIRHIQNLKKAYETVIQQRSQVALMD
jgi:hypothetical protein